MACDGCAAEFDDESEFRTRDRSLSSLCRKCRSNESKRQWRARNPDYARVWRTKNADTIRTKRAEYYKVYYPANREAVIAANARYAASNRDKVNAKSRKWRREHKDQVRMLTTRRRAIQKEAYTVLFTAEELALRWEYYGNKCWICRTDAVATDHVKPLTKGGAHMLCNLRPVCKTCNSRKGNKWPFTNSIITFAETG